MRILLLIIGSVCHVVATNEVDIELIPRNILCPFCIELIGRFKQSTEHDPDYKQVLCKSLSGKSQKNYDSCIKSFSDVTVNILKNSSAEDLCRRQKLCLPQQKIVTLTSNHGIPDFPDIPPVTADQLEDARKQDVLKTIGDALSGKLDYHNRKNLTLFIDLKFRRSGENETIVSDTNMNHTIPVDD